VASRDSWFLHRTAAADGIDQVSQNGWLLSRRGHSSSVHASGIDAHRDSITSRFDCDQDPEDMARMQKQKVFKQLLTTLGPSELVSVLLAGPMGPEQSQLVSPQVRFHDQNRGSD
jgi:hypothetical protein